MTLPLSCTYFCNSQCCYHLIIVVVITDPGIKVDHGYKPYDDGISQGVFIKVCTYVYMYIVVYTRLAMPHYPIPVTKLSLHVNTNADIDH